MNKEMRELMQEMQEKTALAKGYLEAGDTEKAAEMMDTVDALQAKYDTAKRIFEAGKMDVAENAVAEPVKAVQADPVAEFGKAAKMGFRKSANEGTPAAGGYAVPQDIVAKIEAYKEATYSLKGAVNVINVTTNKGSRTFKARGQQTGFAQVGEGAAIGEKATPQFTAVDYSIKKYAGIFPVTNELLADSDASLATTLMQWIAADSNATANRLILAAAKGNVKSSDKAIAGLDGIKSVVNVKVGQAFAGGVKIYTNENGLQALDTLKDENGRYMLCPVPGDTMAMALQVGARAIPLEIVPNDVMPNETDGIPMIIGDLHEGIAFFDRQQMNVMITNTGSVGELNAFEEDLTLYRAIEREDVKVRDAGAFYYGYFTAE